METEVRALIDAKPDGFEPWAEGRVRRTLRRWRHRLERVRAVIRREQGRNGPRTTCRITIERRRGTSVLASGHGHDAETALLNALPRARHRLRRSEQRRISQAIRTRVRDRAIPNAA